MSGLEEGRDAGGKAAVERGFAKTEENGEISEKFEGITRTFSEKPGELEPCKGKGTKGRKTDQKKLEMPTNGSFAGHHARFPQ